MNVNRIVPLDESQRGQVNSQAQKVNDIVGEAVNQPTAEEQEKAERLELLEASRITTCTEVTPETYSLTVDGVGIFAKGDIHGVKGKQKSGKSAVLKVCLSALLCGQQFRVKSELEEPVILFIDTEQQAADVKLIIDEVKNLSHCEDEYIDSHLLLYTMRRMNYETLINDTRLLIEKHRPDVVFIDGLVDFVSSFNDEVISRQLIHELLLLCEEFNCAIVNVLHENKAADDENMRGHLGTVLSQKAGTVLRCFRSKQGLIGVMSSDARHGNMPQWHIFFDGEGHIASADEMWTMQQQAAQELREAVKKAEREQREKERLDAALEVINEHGGRVLRNELTKRMEASTGLSRSVVSKFITKMVEDGKLFESQKMITATAEPEFPF